MQHLKTRFGTWNVTKYPPCILSLISAHRILCLRRKELLKPKKIILALPWGQALPEFKKTIQAKDVDQHYDHIFYQHENSLQKILNESTKEFLLETYTPEGKIKIVVNAPRGQQVKMADEFAELCQQSIALWFSEEEVYWLETQHGE